MANLACIQVQNSSYKLGMHTNFALCISNILKLKIRSKILHSVQFLSSNSCNSFVIRCKPKTVFYRPGGPWSGQVRIKDGNGMGSDQVECLVIPNRNPDLKPKPVPNAGWKFIPETETRGYLKPNWIPEPALYSNIARTINTFYKYVHDIYNIHMYKQEAINSK